jgi:hypothetical protein
VVNPSSRAALAYRIGAHADFVASMLAAIGETRVTPETFAGSAGLAGRVVRGLTPPPGIPADRPLAALTARGTDDFAIGLMDAWAVVLDVLSFYQERIANEGYLRTATEFRSVREIARLVGYAPRPGVSATAYLAFEVEKVSGEAGSRVTIGKGSRAQSVPAAGQAPQTFETTEDLQARDQWSSLVPRKARPHVFEPGQTAPGRRVWFAGLATQLKPNDPLLLVFDAARGEPFRVKAVTPENPERRTRVVLQEFRTVPLTLDEKVATKAATDQIEAAVRGFREGNEAELAQVIAARVAVESTLEALLADDEIQGKDDTDPLSAEAAGAIKSAREALTKMVGKVAGPATLAPAVREYLVAVIGGLGELTEGKPIGDLRKLERETRQKGARLTPDGEDSEKVNLEVGVDRAAAGLLAASEGIKQFDALLLAFQARLTDIRQKETELLKRPGYSELGARVTLLARRVEEAIDQLMLNFVLHDISKKSEFGNAKIDGSDEGGKEALDVLNALARERFPLWKDPGNAPRSPLDLINRLARDARDIAGQAEAVRVLLKSPAARLEVPDLHYLRTATFLAVAAVLRRIVGRYAVAGMAGVEADTRLAIPPLGDLLDLRDDLSREVPLRTQFQDAQKAVREAVAELAPTGLTFAPVREFADILEAMVFQAGGGPTLDQQRTLLAAIEQYTASAASALAALEEITGELRRAGADDSPLKLFEGKTREKAQAIIDKAGKEGGFFGGIVAIFDPPPTPDEVKRAKEFLAEADALRTRLQSLVPRLEPWARERLAIAPDSILFQLAFPDKELAEYVLRAATDWETGMQPVRKAADATSAAINVLRPVLPALTNVEDLLGRTARLVAQARQARRLAEAGNYPRVLPWLAEMLGELEGLLADLDFHPTPIDEANECEGNGGGPAPQAALATQAERVRLSRRAAAERGTVQRPDLAPQLAIAFNPELAHSLYTAITNTRNLRRQRFQGVYALRARAAPFGHNAPRPGGPASNAGDWPLHTTGEVRDAVVVGLTAWTPAGGFRGAKVRITAVANGIAHAPAEFEPPGDSAGSTPVNIGTGAITGKITLPKPDPATAVGAVLRIELGGALKRSIEIATPKAEPLNLVVNGTNIPPGATSFALESLVTDATLSVGGTERSLVLITRQYASLKLTPNVITLDAVYDKVTPGSYIVIERAETKPKFEPLNPLVARVEAVTTLTPTDFGLAGVKVTRLTLDRSWLDPKSDFSLADIRGVTVYLQSEPLELDGEPYDADLGPVTAGDPAAAEIELDSVYGGLTSGRLLVVAGERTDTKDTSGVKHAELVVLDESIQLVDAAGTRGQGHPHTLLRLRKPLVHSYQRATVTVYGNVVKSNHGETKAEVLGSGNAAVAGQRFTLKQSPLTHIAAPTPAGVEDTLEVRVNGVRWRRAERITDLGPADRKFLLQTNPEGKSVLLFGDGTRGSRLPTGAENVRAVYRVGLGRDGNVDPNKITQLLSRPLGVKGVTNPLAATGGADAEPLDEVRRNAPVGITALDRLVSVTDYADFARAFAGIARSAAALLANGTRRLVHVTVAGRDGDPIPPNTELYTNLLEALREYGEPGTAVAVDSRVLRFLQAEAKIRVHPDHEFATVEAAVRTRLLAAFGFDARDFARPLYLSEFIAAAQAVTGVVAVNVTRFNLINEPASPGASAAGSDQADLECQLRYLSKQLRAPVERLPERLAVRTARFVDGKIVPAELAFLPARVPDLLTLTEWK